MPKRSSPSCSSVVGKKVKYEFDKGSEAQNAVGKSGIRGESSNSSARPALSRSNLAAHNREIEPEARSSIFGPYFQPDHDFERSRDTTAEHFYMHRNLDLEPMATLKSTKSLPEPAICASGPNDFDHRGYPDAPGVKREDAEPVPLSSQEVEQNIPRSAWFSVLPEVSSSSPNLQDGFENLGQWESEFFAWKSNDTQQDTGEFPRDAAGHQYNLIHISSFPRPRAPELAPGIADPLRADVSLSRSDAFQIPPPPDLSMIVPEKENIAKRTFYWCTKDRCDFVGSREQVTEHHREEHNINTKPSGPRYRCWWPSCHTTCTSVADIMRHEDKPHYEVRSDLHKCQFPGCGSISHSSSESDRHYNLYHRDRSRGWFHCLRPNENGSPCSRRGVDAFRRLDHLKDHQKRVHGRDAFRRHDHLKEHHKRGHAVNSRSHL